MFSNCAALTSLDLSNFDTQNVTNMYSMFNYCSALPSLDLSSFNTEKVTNMSYMFYGCTSLVNIFVTNKWSTAAVTSSVRMFFNCTSLVGGQGTTYKYSHIDAAYAHIDGGENDPGYLSTYEIALRGDVNLDGIVDVADAVSVLNAMAGQEVSGEADVNGDGSIDIADLVTVLNIMAGQ